MNTFLVTIHFIWDIKMQSAPSSWLLRPRFMGISSSVSLTALWWFHFFGFIFFTLCSCSLTLSQDTGLTANFPELLSAGLCPGRAAGSLCFVRNLIKTTLGPGCNQCDAIKAGTSSDLQQKKANKTKQNKKTCWTSKHAERNLPQSPQGHFWVFLGQFGGTFCDVL